MAVTLVMCIGSYVLDKIYNFSLPWCAEVAFFVVFFIALGYAMKDKVIEIVDKINSEKMLYPVSCALLIGSIIFSHCNYKLTGLSVDLSNGNYCNFALTMISAFCGVSFILLISKKITTPISLYLGKNTLFIYLFHYFLFIGNVDRHVFAVANDVLNNEFISGIVAGLIFMVVVLVVTSLLSIPYNYIMNKIKNKIF